MEASKRGSTLFFTSQTLKNEFYMGVSKKRGTQKLTYLAQIDPTGINIKIDHLTEYKAKRLDSKTPLYSTSKMLNDVLS